MTKISIIMACKDHQVYTQLAIARLIQNTYNDFELIIADDSVQPIDMFITELVESGIDYTVLYPPTPRDGAAHARNDCLRNSHYEYVIDVDNDVMVTPGWDRPLIEKLEAEPDIGLLIPMQNDLYFFDKESQIYEGSRVLNFWDVCVRFKHFRTMMSPDLTKEGVQGLEHILNETYGGSLDNFAKSYAERNKNREPVHLMNTWASWATRLSIMKDVGGYDENYKKAGYEDLDLARRLNMLNYRTIITFNSYIHHCMSTTRPFIPGAVQAETNNSEYYRRKFTSENLNPREEWLKQK
ncbi:MAG: glycosyltransferase family 2 protein [Gammaproteobacteria bacterium]|nr:glycosyltransferase family 2 protein [Gammaproteobacteria bacterium]